MRRWTFYLTLTEEEFTALGLYSQCEFLATGWEGGGLCQPPGVQDWSSHWMQEEVVSTDFLQEFKTLGKLTAESSCYTSRKNLTSVFQSGEAGEWGKDWLWFWYVIITSWQKVFHSLRRFSDWGLRGCGRWWMMRGGWIKEQHEGTEEGREIDR